MDVPQTATFLHCFKDNNAWSQSSDPSFTLISSCHPVPNSSMPPNHLCTRLLGWLCQLTLDVICPWIESLLVFSSLLQDPLAVRAASVNTGFPSCTQWSPFVVDSFMTLEFIKTEKRDLFWNRARDAELVTCSFLSHAVQKQGQLAWGRDREHPNDRQRLWDGLKGPM